jgi:pyridoxamine 5'-phosphate oxidase
MRQRFGSNVPLPTFWGGFRIEPSRIEFWQGRENRLHDRIVYKLIDGAWIIERLSP